jgi:hypothetical protein
MPFKVFVIAAPELNELFRSLTWNDPEGGHPVRVVEALGRLSGIGVQQPTALMDWI